MSDEFVSIESVPSYCVKLVFGHGARSFVVFIIELMLKNMRHM